MCSAHMSASSSFVITSATWRLPLSVAIFRAISIASSIVIRNSSSALIAIAYLLRCESENGLRNDRRPGSGRPPSRQGLAVQPFGRRREQALGIVVEVVEALDALPGHAPAR